MRELGLRDPVVEERDTDLLVTILHEPLASPEEKIMEHLAKYPTIKNKKARELTFVKDADQMKRILQKMVEKDMIEGVPNTRGGGFTYQVKKKSGNDKHSNEPLLPFDPAN
jgi:ATP-dependent DNA helicase RecG